MNLILSDVEETIMLVDAQEGAPTEQAQISVRCFEVCSTRSFNPAQVAKRKMEMLFVRGDGVILVCYINLH